MSPGDPPSKLLRGARAPQGSHPGPLGQELGVGALSREDERKAGRLQSRQPGHWALVLGRALPQGCRAGRGLGG